MQVYSFRIRTLSFHVFFGIAMTFAFFYSCTEAETHYHEFTVQETPVRRLCKTVKVVTVNGQLPGPTLEVQDGDFLIIKVVNSAQYNITIHWHGVLQLRNPWADGPEYITQCPIQPGGAYTYRFTIQNQVGTLWWHAHAEFLRTTVYGALIIYPRLGSHFPFPKPRREFTVLLGEWWDRDPQSVRKLALVTGAAFNISDAFTINGQPGDLYRCSGEDTAIFPVDFGETILLRIINSAMNQELFFAVANHKFTVVGTDAAAVKPFVSDVIMIAPGQTINALLTADQPPGHYYMAARAYQSANNVFDNTTTTAILRYKSAPCTARNRPSIRPILPLLPGFNDTATANRFTAQFRSPGTVNVPKVIDDNLFITTGLGLINCSAPSIRCQGPNNTRFTSSMNNISFQLPSSNSIQQAYYQGVNGVFTADFPASPPVQFNYSGNVPRGLWTPIPGTKVYKVKYGSNVQVVMQDTSIVTTEDHPMHLHGYQFYVVGMGVGNYDPQRDPVNFNLVDPPNRNTIGTPPGGWVAIRFLANNPGAWLMHCHIDSHLQWGLAMVFLVENGVGKLQAVQPPPLDLPQC